MICSIYFTFFSAFLLQEHLFEQLFQLLSRALAAPEGREQLASLRLLACKVRRSVGLRLLPLSSTCECVGQPAPAGISVLRHLNRSMGLQVEEITTTLRKHLRKEEEQLLPLLLAHFSTAEQAELVAQFLCSIPLSTVEVGWASIIFFHGLLC